MLALHTNLQRLLAIRVIVFLCQIAAIVINELFIGIALQLLPVTLILVFFVAVNVALYVRLGTERPVTHTEFVGHLFMDVAGLSLLMYFTGGASNPFVSFLLVPVMIAAVTLPVMYTWTVAVSALTSYTLLLFYFYPIPDLMPDSHDMGAMDQEASGFSPHILGMWANFLVSAGLITWFVVRMAAEIRNQQSQLARLREATLRNEKILGIATQAAATAHELGTPLSTMAVLLKDMALEENDADRGAVISVLRDQVATCRTTLQKLVSRTESEMDEGESNLARFIDSLLDQWQLLRPEVVLDTHRSEDENECRLVKGDGLQHALINLLNNAADAGDNKVSLQSSITGNRWLLTITDTGPGLTPSVKQRLGLDVVSTKQSGLGMGFMLSHATLERLGGSVSMEDVVAGGKVMGTITRILVPVSLSE